MVLVTPKGQLKRLMTSLYNEGVLDREFELLRRLQDADHPGFIVDMLSVFCNESDSICSEIDRLLERPSMDYHRIVAYVHRLKESCSSVGGRRVKAYCEEVNTSYEKNDIEGIMRALNGIKHETFRLQNQFQKVIELEIKILQNSTA